MLFDNLPKQPKPQRETPRAPVSSEEDGTLEVQAEVSSFMRKIEAIAACLDVSTRIHEEKQGKVFVYQALAILIGMRVTDDDLDDFMDEVREWRGSADYLNQENAVLYRAAIRDARFKDEFESGKKVIYAPAKSKNGRRKR
jgi:hypothetical protein